MKYNIDNTLVQKLGMKTCSIGLNKNLIDISKSKFANIDFDSFSNESKAARLLR